MDKPARAAAEVLLDLLVYADPARVAAPSDERITEILSRLLDENAIALRRDRTGEVFVDPAQLAIGAMELLTWLVEQVAQFTAVPRAEVLGDLRAHIAVS